MKLSDEVVSVLGRSKIEPDRVTLPEQLDRALYVQVNKALLAAGGKWSRKDRAHVFSRDPREVLGLATKTGEVRDTRKELQQFYTPPELARRMVRLAQIRSHHIVLEPSAGQGAIVDAVLEIAPHARIKCVEIDPENASDLRKRSGSIMVIEGDFLAQRGLSPNRVVMNPPFANHQALDHVTAAWEMLQPGGVLVSITPTLAGYEGSGIRKRAEFAQLLRENDAMTLNLPAGIFPGTQVATSLIRMVKPGE